MKAESDLVVPSKTESAAEFQTAIAEAKAVDELVSALRNKVEKFYDQIPESIEHDYVTNRHMMLGCLEQNLLLAGDQLRECSEEIECIIANLECAALDLVQLPTADEARADLKRYNAKYGCGSND